MKFHHLDNVKLGQILLIAPTFAAYHNHSTIKKAIAEMDPTAENTLELEYVNDLFSLDTKEINDKWFDGDDGIVGVFYTDE